MKVEIFTPHMGNNVRQIRVFKGMKQTTLAIELGMTPTRVSEIENSPIIEESLLIQIATILNVTPEIIKEFNQHQVFYNIDNKLDNTTISETGHGIHQVFSPIEKVVELYERLLASEKEKLEILKNKIK